MFGRTKQQPATQEAPTPTPEDVVAELAPLRDRAVYQAAMAKVDRLHDQRKERARRLEDLEAAWRDQTRQEKEGGPEARARQVLEGGELVPQGERLRSEIVQLRAEIQELDRAIRLGKQDVGLARREAGGEALQEVIPAYLELGSEMAEALLRLSELAAREHHFRRAYEAKGFSAASLPLSLYQVRVDVRQSLGRAWAERARGYGVDLALPRPLPS